jgi:menaquinone-dependent protoporphyrinogen oxidase
MTVIRRRWFLGTQAACAAVKDGFRVATLRPAPNLISSTCQGTDEMHKTILVADATRTGSTAEVAEAIARGLCDAGLDADVHPVADIDTLNGFDGAVLGSAVRCAAWLPEMLDFLKSRKKVLSTPPVAFFTMYILALGDDPAAKAERTKYTTKARKYVQPIEEIIFEGMVDVSRLSFFDRLAVQFVKSPVGDRRDWKQIGKWADALAPKLLA